ncbi:hypothetical protein RJT34_14119 [Clitoria ternatea]|uniref:Uncharacterized protein n=1 Tax=Clitoria ternatea TaxID=43366 RepID=A0AAN9JSQ8_CLITE
MFDRVQELAGEFLQGDIQSLFGCVSPTKLSESPTEADGVFLRCLEATQEEPTSSNKQYLNLTYKTISQAPYLTNYLLTIIHEVTID